MKKLSQIMIFAVLFILALSSLAMAAEAETAVKVAGLKVFYGIVIAAGFGIAVAAVGGGLAQGMAIKGAVEGTARNPEAGGKITTTMIIGLALIESLVIYTLVVALILLYAYPMSGPIKTLVGME